MFEDTGIPTTPDYMCRPCVGQGWYPLADGTARIRCARCGGSGRNKRKWIDLADEPEADSEKTLGIPPAGG